MSYFVYIIQSDNSGKYYIGSTDNVERRLREHNRGKTEYTRNRGPWILRINQKYSTKEKARKIEFRLKKLKRRDYVEKIIKDGCIKMK